MNNLASNLRNFRVLNNLTQTEIAKKLNINFKTYSHWENGRSNPDIEMLIILANFFDVSIDELLGRDAPAILEVKQDNDLVELIKNYKKLSEKQKQHVRIVISTLLDDKKNLYKELFGNGS